MVNELGDRAQQALGSPLGGLQFGTAALAPVHGLGNLLERALIGEPLLDQWPSVWHSTLRK